MAAGGGGRADDDGEPNPYLPPAAGGPGGGPGPSGPANAFWAVPSASDPTAPLPPDASPSPAPPAGTDPPPVVLPPVAPRPPSQTPSPAPQSPPAHPFTQVSRSPSRRRLVVGIVALAAAVLYGLNALVGSIGELFDSPTDPRGPASTGAPASPGGTSTADPTGPTASPSTADGELPIAWQVDPASIVAGADLVYSWDGQVDSSQIAVTPDAWIVGLGANYSTLEHVAGLDPRSGGTLWTHEIGHGACAHDVVDAVLACLTTSSAVPEDGVAAEPYVLARIDVATGEVTEVPTTLTSVWSLHHRPEGLLVLGVTEPNAPHASLSLLAADGSVKWTTDVGEVAGAELMFSDVLSGSGDKPDPNRTMERVRWRDLDGGTALLWSQPGAMLVDLATGPVGDVIDCNRATPARDALYCMSYDKPGDTSVTSVHRYDLTGSLQWSTPGVRLAYPSDSSPARPAFLRDRELIGLDLATGAPGELLHSFATPGAQVWTGNVAEPSGYGDASRAVVIGEDDAAVGLLEGADQVAWTVPVSEEAYVWDVLLLDGVTVLHLSDAAVGLDPVTGAELWRFAGVETDSVAAGDAIAEAGYRGITRRDVP
ncbi:hypothetical protein C8046_09785 [Serinibacter arcticus]|uniref:Uncharacterized protein n=1 Tax=Serinibacter arcticus TaxID=1655435 RepID=A0A2U1ZV96_9MICO|nr:hypothetical protein [Serinibacter arcticus]PWD50899.1 hypothetical protein C8046_09785 [Serinibacter arcticus]